jgi:predicted dehydrogenase
LHRDQAVSANLDVTAQEMTLFYWFLGDHLQRICGWGGRLSRLEIEANDYWQIIGQTRNAVAVTLQYDLLRRAGYRASRFISETGIIELALTDGFARRYHSATKQWETVTPPPGFNYEQCYIDEIALFIECIRGRGPWHNPLPTAMDVVRFLTAMLASCERQQWMEIKT